MNNIYKQNTKQIRKIDFQYPKSFFEEFKKGKTEEERIELLYRYSKKTLELFEKTEIWEEGKIPGEDKKIKGQERPCMYFFPCEGRKRAKGVVLVVPGGGYNCIASEIEGYPIIKKLLSEGYSAALLIYRLKPYTQYESLEDIKRAIRLLRYNALEWEIPTDKIFLQGSSAGGHLCTMASVHYDNGNEKAKDPIERISSRPDGAIISYGVFSQVSYPKSEEFFQISKEMEPKEVILQSCYSDVYRKDMVFCSPEKFVTTDTPPMFLWQTCDEDDPRKLFVFAKELADYGIRFEIHIFPYGGHGNGLWDGESGTGEKDDHVAHWFELAIEWMEQTMEKTDGFKTD